MYTIFLDFFRLFYCFLLFKRSGRVAQKRILVNIFSYNFLEFAYFFLLFYFFSRKLIIYEQFVILPELCMNVINKTKGVREVRGRKGPYYVASIIIKGKRHHLYSGKNFLDALQARLWAEQNKENLK